MVMPGVKVVLSRQLACIRRISVVPCALASADKVSPSRTRSLIQLSGGPQVTVATLADGSAGRYRVRPGSSRLASRQLAWLMACRLTP